MRERERALTKNKINANIPMFFFMSFRPLCYVQIVSIDFYDENIRKQHRKIKSHESHECGCEMYTHSRRSCHSTRVMFCGKPQRIKRKRIRRKRTPFVILERRKLLERGSFEPISHLIAIRRRDSFRSSKRWYPMNAHPKSQRSDARLSDVEF